MKNLKDFIINNKANFDNYHLRLSMQDFIDFEPTKSKKEYLSKFGDYSYYEFENFADYFENSFNNYQATYLFTNKYGLGFYFNEGRPYIFIDDGDQLSDTFGDGLLLIFLPFDNYKDLKFNLNKIELLALDILYAFNC